MASTSYEGSREAKHLVIASRIVALDNAIDTLNETVSRIREAPGKLSDKPILVKSGSFTTLFEFLTDTPDRVAGMTERLIKLNEELNQLLF